VKTPGHVWKPRASRLARAAANTGRSRLRCNDRSRRRGC
jgi:hypothetical protein